MTRSIRINEFNKYYRSGNAEFRRFHGGKVRHIKDYVPTHLKNPPDSVIILAGGNDLPTPKEKPVPVLEIANDIIEAGIICEKHGVQEIYISSVLPRKVSYMQRRGNELNDILKSLCYLHNFTFIDNYNITHEHLLQDGVHLSNFGSDILANNFLDLLNGDV